MKLRIRGDSLRLRLTQGEVQAFVDSGRVEDTTSFGASRLEYALAFVDLPRGQTLAARLNPTPQGSRIEVRVDAIAGRTWAKSDAVGMESVDGPLRLLVEKDYACLKERPEEDDADAFPNPHASC